MGSCARSFDGHSDLVCENVPKSVFLNALSDSLPECDRTEGMSTLADRSRADMCYVYCAQRSCGAATAFMEKHKAELRDKCSMITYLHNGALGMEASDLVDGPTCHRKIVESNLEKGIKGTCLTCDKTDTGHDLPMVANGEAMHGRLVTTRGEVPDWYARSGIVASLPTQFSCDERYYPPRPHRPKKASLQLEIDVSGTDLPGDAIIAYWASHETDTIQEAAKAYGEFDNSGIVQCRNARCHLSLDRPGMYTTNGMVYKPHIHFTEWKGDRWNTTAKTIEFPS